MFYIGDTVIKNNQKYHIQDIDNINQVAKIGIPDNNGIVWESEWVYFLKISTTDKSRSKMKVKELIEKLNEFDMDMDIEIFTSGKIYDVLRINIWTENDKISTDNWIENPKSVVIISGGWDTSLKLKK